MPLTKNTTFNFLKDPKYCTLLLVSFHTKFHYSMLLFHMCHLHQVFPSHFHWADNSCVIHKMQCFTCIMSPYKQKKLGTLCVHMIYNVLYLHIYQKSSKDISSILNHIKQKYPKLCPQTACYSVYT